MLSEFAAPGRLHGVGLATLLDHLSQGYMFAFNVKDGSLPGGQFYLNVPVSLPEMYVFRSIADVRPQQSHLQTLVSNPALVLCLL